MIRALRKRGIGRTELAIGAAGVLAALVALAAFGRVAQVTTHKTETVERRTTTTERVPTRPSASAKAEAPAGRGQATPVGSRPPTTRDVAALRAAVVALRAETRRVHARIRGEVASFCIAHNFCKGDPGARGDQGATGPAGRDAPGSREHAAHTLDSTVVDFVDNRLRDVETTTGALLARLDTVTARIGVLERALALVCRLLTPGRCPA